MASIYKANDIKEKRTVALKVPFMQFESDPGFFTRFKREQEIGTSLNHPYILRVDPDEGDRSRPYLVMEYLDGQTLGHLMRSVRPMPVNDALKIVSRICEALHYMHDHDVVHRDLKPENIMILNDGSIRIMDFGIAKVEHQRRLTFGGFTPAMGTPDYMAPEQVKGKRGDRRTDIYSLGAILYEMVTGSVPFEGANPFIIMNARVSGDPVAPRHKNHEIAPQVEEIILHAMARNPADRYATAMEMKNDVDHPDQVQVTGRASRPRGAGGMEKPVAKGTNARPGCRYSAACPWHSLSCSSSNVEVTGVRPTAMQGPECRLTPARRVFIEGRTRSPDQTDRATHRRAGQIDRDDRRGQPAHHGGLRQSDGRQTDGRRESPHGIVHRQN